MREKRDVFLIGLFPFTATLKSVLLARVVLCRLFADLQIMKHAHSGTQLRQCEMRERLNQMLRVAL